MNKIHEYLNTCARNYYNGESTVSDEVFDQLSEASGFDSLGAKQHEHLEKHLFPMYSLQKIYEDEGRESPLRGYKHIVTSPKIDGAALSLLYINGVLVRALTRGDGIEGTIVTDKFLDSKFVPQTINLDGIVQITGEVAAPKYIENARNYAAGALNLKDASEFKTRAVTFFAYGVQPQIMPNWPADMVALSKLGFNTIKDPDIGNIYPCDGIVFRLSDNAEFYAAGYTSKFPKGAYALKERGVAVETTLLDVEWQVGKSGKVTPVAILESVMVGDAEVSRATLNNIAFIRALGLAIGDRVGIVRAGEIIPQVTHKIE